MMLDNIVKCDLHVPKEIHHKLKQYPPAPEILTPDNEWMSDYQLDLQKKLHIKSKSDKLIPHLLIIIIIVFITET